MPGLGIGLDLDRQGGAGAAPPFSPADLAGLVLWGKADAGTFQDTARTTPATADTDPVGGWADQSGAGTHLSQATAGARPLLKLAIKNGLPVLRFDGSNDTLGLSLALGTSHTTFLVLNLASRNILMGENAVNRYIEAQAAATAYVTAGETATQAMAWTLSTWYVFGIRRGVDSVEFRRNGAVVGTQDLGTGGDGITLANLSGPSFFAGMDVGEILSYSRQLTGPEAAQVEAYLNSRFSVY
jgi:hypothetical protein